MLPNSGEAAWLGIIRIYTGIFWLIHGVQKLVNPQFAGNNGMMVHIIGEAGQNASAPYHAFLTTVVLPNANAFAHLVAWGETLTGVSLLLGLLARVGGLGGMFLTLNYMLMKGSFATIDGYAGLDAAAFALSFLSLVLPTGMRFGLDGLIFGRAARASTKAPPDWARA